MRARDWSDWEQGRRERYERGAAKIRPDGGPFVGDPLPEAEQELLDFGNYLDEHHRQTGEDVGPLMLAAWELWAAVRGRG